MRKLDWSSYDDVAETYDTVSVPRYFRAPAERLAALLEISRGDRVLDVGAGTGVFAASALRLADRVTATDVSLPMLIRGRERSVKNAVAARLPPLPMADGSFERVGASFLLNHLADSRSALRELRRVLTQRGRLGVTSWAVGPSDNKVGELWNETAWEFVDSNALAEGLERALPGEGELANPETLRALLSGAGLPVSTLEQREYAVSIPVEDYLASRSLAMTARFMKKTLSAAEWRRFEGLARQRLLARFGSHFELTTRVNFTVAAR